METEKQPIFTGRLKCPYCGYEMPVWFTANSQASDVWVRCKGKHCKKLIEVQTNETK